MLFRSEHREALVFDLNLITMPVVRSWLSMRRLKRTHVVRNPFSKASYALAELKEAWLEWNSMPMTFPQGWTMVSCEGLLSIGCLVFLVSTAAL